MYAKRVLKKILSSTKVNLWDILENPDGIKEYRDMFDDLHSNIVLEAEKAYIQAMNTILQQVSGVALLEGEGNEGRCDFTSHIDEIDTVIERIPKLNLEYYTKGSTISTPNNFSTTIMIYNTLTQCIVDIEGKADGVYLCYIRVGDTANGYFGVFIKSNGNLLSFNERPNEAYPGQHANSRNGRWSDDKAYDIFPYEEVLSFDDYDYKGYSHIHKIDDSKAEFKYMGKYLYTVVLTMVLVSNRACMGKADAPIVYIDALIGNNLKQLSNSNQLIALGSSALVNNMRTFAVDFTQSDIIAGTPSLRFDHTTSSSKSYFEKGSFPEQTPDSTTQLYIDLYAKNINLDDLNPERLLESNSYLLTSGRQVDKNAAPTPEFVGTPERMQMEAYRKGREVLANHIEHEMEQEYIRYGGAKAVYNWWRDAIEKKREALEQVCAAIYARNNIKTLSVPEGYIDWNDETYRVYDYNKIRIDVYPDTKYKTPMGRVSTYLCPCDLRRDVAYDPVDSTKCSVYFIFRPDNWKELEEISGQEVPKLVKGWDRNGRAYSGNPLLDATDAVCRIQNPLYDLNSIHGKYDKYGLGSYINFDFVIGFSKRRLMRLIKQWGN